MSHSASSYLLKGILPDTLYEVNSVWTSPWHWLSLAGCQGLTLVGGVPQCTDRWHSVLVLEPHGKFLSAT